MFRGPRSCIVAALLAAAGARAEGSPDGGTPACDDKPEACGRQAFELGVAAYKAGDFKTAVARFTEALGYKWHPAIALNLALAEAQAGRYVEALQHLEAIIGNPETSSLLHEQAMRERERVTGELALIEVDTGDGGTSTFTIDSVPVDPKTPARVDPGAHHLELTLSSGPSVRRDVVLAPRERLRLSIDRTHELILVPEPKQRVVARPPQDSAHATPEGMRVDPIWFYVGVGATAVLGGVTIWSALDTQAAHDDYARLLPTLSQAEVDRRVAEGHSLETRTNILIAATGIAAVGTATLGVFFVRWRPTSTVVASPLGLSFRETF